MPTRSELIDLLKLMVGFWSQVGQLSAEEILDYYQEMFSLAIDTAQKPRGPAFDRVSFVAQIDNTYEHYRMNTCGRGEDYCRRKDCVSYDPGCQTRKVRVQIKRMMPAILQFLECDEEGALPDEEALEIIIAGAASASRFAELSLSQLRYLHSRSYETLVEGIVRYEDLDQQTTIIRARRLIGNTLEYWSAQGCGQDINLCTRRDCDDFAPACIHRKICAQVMRAIEELHRLTIKEQTIRKMGVGAPVPPQVPQDVLVVA